MALYCLRSMHRLPISLEAAWEFFSSPHNLKTLTPGYLKFEILSLSRDSLYPGQIIEYRMRPVASFPIKWVTEITQVKDKEYFIDEQRFGPYQFWHHEHHFTPIVGGVEMIDIVYYKMPLGPIGQLINYFKVENDLQKIFTFRSSQLNSLFGTYTQ